MFVPFILNFSLPFISDGSELCKDELVSYELVSFEILNFSYGFKSFTLGCIKFLWEEIKSKSEKNTAVFKEFIKNLGKSRVIYLKNISGNAIKNKMKFLLHFKIDGFK